MSPASVDHTRSLLDELSNRIVGQDAKRAAQEAAEARERFLAYLATIGGLLRDLDGVLEKIRTPDVLAQLGGNEALNRALELRSRLMEIVRTYARDEAWFWTEEWQAGERAAEAQIAAGEGIVFEDDDSLIAFLAHAGSNAHAGG